MKTSFFPQIFTTKQLVFNVERSVYFCKQKIAHRIIVNYLKRLFSFAEKHFVMTLLVISVFDCTSNNLLQKHNRTFPGNIGEPHSASFVCHFPQTRVLWHWKNILEMFCFLLSSTGVEIRTCSDNAAISQVRVEFRWDISQQDVHKIIVTDLILLRSLNIYGVLKPVFLYHVMNNRLLM